MNTFWSSRDFVDNLGKLLPNKEDQSYFNELEGDERRKDKRIQGSSVELSLGSEVFISGQRELRRLTEDDNLVKIAPGDFALLITKEWVAIPEDCMGFIAMKSKHKLRDGVDIHKKGAHWGQNSIEPQEMMPLIGAGVNVHELDHRLRTVETMVKIYGGILIGIFLVLLKFILGKPLFTKEKQK
jgi:hypothetical protein